jgi:hypothetical protein
MITGNFDASVGSITLQIDDGGATSTMQITDLGSLNYNFDQTPESVTVDRVQALYNFINVTILYQDEYGFDLWERLIDSTISLEKIPCKLTINPWDAESYEFNFKLRIGDLSVSEKSGTIQLKLNPNFDQDVDIETVFDIVASDANKVRKFKRESVTGTTTQVIEYDAIGVKDFIDVALNEVFDNNYANTVKPSLSGLSSDYTTELYDTIQTSGEKKQLLIVDMPGNTFPASEGRVKIVTGTGTITVVSPESPSITYEIYGTGTNFLGQVDIGDRLFVTSNRKFDSQIIKSVGADVLTFDLDYIGNRGETPQPEDFGIVDEPFSIIKQISVMEQPALKALKDLAGIEGSVFGSGFSENFYFNRLRGDAGEDISIDYETQVVDINPKPYYLSLGTSLVSQRADYRRVGEKQFGVYPSTIDVQNRGLPNLTDRGSIARGNENATKELKIELAPAYPMLNKGIRENDGTFNGDIILQDTQLESALTANGLSSYFQALNSISGNIYIEVTLLGAFTIKPYNTISFGSDAPERYADKTFRPTTISYDLKNDTVTIKAYQINTIFNQALTDLGFNFAFGEQLLQEGLIQAVQAQSGEAVNRIQQALFRTATIVPLNLGTAIQRIDLITTGADIGEQEAEVGLLSKDDNIIVFDPITLKSERFIVSANQSAGQSYVLVELKSILGQFPAGSYVYISQKNVTAGVKIAENSVQIFNETNLVGITLATVDSTTATSLSARLYERIKAGTDLFLGDQSSGNVISVNVTNSVGPGDVTVNIEENNLTFLAGTRLYGSESQKQAILQVDPFRVLTAVTQTKAQQAIATLNGDLAIGTYTSIPITSPRAMSLLPSSIIMVQDRTGATQYFTTTAVSQNLAGASTIATLSTTTTTALEGGASVLEPSWRQSSQITSLSNEIQLRVTELRLQEYVAENLSGLLPAENFTFINTDEGFVGNGVTLTNNTDYVEYLVTNDADPYMQRTVSYDADDNPVVTIFLQLITGTLPASWNCRFGWTTDGSTWYEQAFLQPANVGNDFQFTTIDLTSNVDYTGTITAIRLYLGADVNDEYYIGQFTIGKYNPQTEILTDLTTRLTTAEGNITITANEINSYVTGTQGLNKIADVTGVYGSGSSYTSLTLTNIRSGASVLDNQIFILQNSDGSFQQVTADGNQDPLVSPMAINSITFSEDINGAILYEPSYAATSRITQSAGELVLKASVVSGEITKLALVRLDATAVSGSEIFLQADKIIVDGQTTFLNSLKTNGIARTADVSTTIRSTTAPTLRADGTAIQAGDTWIKTDTGNLPHTYDGTSPFNISGWIRDYTQIDGGDITTGTVNTNRLNVNDILAQNASITGTLTMGATGIIVSNSSTGFKIENDRILFGENLGGSGAISEVTYEGLFLSSTVSTIGKFNFGEMLIATDSVNPTTDKARLIFSNTAGSFTLHDENNNQVFGFTLSNGASRFYGGTSENVRFDTGIEARGDLRIYDSDESHYYNIVGGNLAGDIQLNLPVLTANRTFAFIDQAQTFTATNTFTTINVNTQINTGTIFGGSGISLRTGGFSERIKIGSGTGEISFFGLPTSSSGLASGRIWNDSGTLKIIP